MASPSLPSWGKWHSSGDVSPGGIPWHGAPLPVPRTPLRAPATPLEAAAITALRNHLEWFAIRDSLTPDN